MAKMLVIETCMECESCVWGDTIWWCEAYGLNLGSGTEAALGFPDACELENAPRWVLVSEGQPKDTGPYWVCRIGPITSIPYYTADYWTGGVWMGEHRPEQNLAWQPILPFPRLPKEEVNDGEVAD